MFDTMVIKPELFRQYCDLTFQQSGIVLKEGKEPLLIARIAKRQRVLGLSSPQEYFEYLEADSTGEELVAFLDVITTNFTRFFRESEHFKLLERMVKRWAYEGHTRMRFWSAASSTGEEPYSMAIAILEAIGDGPIDLRILATDISTVVLQKARDGLYDARALEPLPSALRHRYFQRVGGKNHPLWQAKPRLRQTIVFKRLNLSAPPFPMHGPFDAVFCRNVMIYFDRHVRQRLISSIENLIKPNGILAIGHAETLTGMKTRLRAFQPSVYTRPEI